MGIHMSLKFVVLFGFLAGSGGSIIGSLLVYPIKLNRRIISIAMEFFSGIMLSVICFCLIPQSFYIGQKYMSFLGLICGVIFAVALQSIIKYIPKNLSGRKFRIKATGVVLACICILMNFTEGLSIGSGFWISTAVGFPAFLVIMINNIPKGALTCAAFRYGSVRMIETILLCALFGIPTAIGTICGIQLGGARPDLIATAICFSGGAMLYIAEGELIPESKRLYTGRSSGFFNVLGMVFGAVIACIT